MLTALAGLLLTLQTSTPQAPLTDLAGPWRFHTGDAPVWALPGFDDSDWDTLTVPGLWRLPEEYRGYVWYRRRITLRAPIGEPLGLWLRSVATAYEVYVDGQRVGGIGGFPPRYRARSVVPLVVSLPAALQTPGTHVIAVRVYSSERLGGITGAVILGPVQTLEREMRRPDLYLMGAAVLLLGIGMMQIFFWLRRPTAREHAAIFGVCAALALFFFLWMPSVRLALEPYVHWLRLYLVSAAACAAAYCYAFRRLFDLDRGDRVLYGFTVLFLVEVALFAAAPGWSAVRSLSLWLLNPTLLLCAATTLVLAVQQLRSGARHARILVWGVALLTVTLFHDILLNYGLLPVQPTFPWLILVGSVAFVASLALTTAEKFVESETAALYDQLTGLYRREVVMDALAHEIRRSVRVGAPLAVIMLDVDRFKPVNDTLGHLAGDKVLAEIGRRLTEAGRAVDWLGRYGGEEFIAVLAATGTESALLAAERLRSAVSALPIATGRTTRTITMSAGVAAFEGGADWPTVEQLVGAADTALYRAKDAGRNCVKT